MTEANEGMTIEQHQNWWQRQADGAGRYATFAEFQTQVIMADRDMHGWVDENFYHLYPGGRCIDYTDSVKARVDNE